MSDQKTPGPEVTGQPEQAGPSRRKPQQNRSTGRNRHLCDPAGSTARRKISTGSRIPNYLRGQQPMPQRMPQRSVLRHRSPAVRCGMPPRARSRVGFSRRSCADVRSAVGKSTGMATACSVVPRRPVRATISKSNRRHGWLESAIGVSGIRATRTRWHWTRPLPSEDEQLW